VRTLGVIALIALAGFGYLAARLTFTPIDDGGQAVGNTDIGRSLRFYLDRPSVKQAVLQVGGNLVLLAPLGVLLPVAFARLRGVLRMAVVAALVSLAVEITQGTLIRGRAFDIDDVILNIAGVVLAYLLAGRKFAELIRGPA
jgi:VanZ like family